MGTTLLKNGTILTETETIKNGYVLIEGEKIVSIGRLEPEFHADVEIDVKGHIISPGFIDIHTHGIKDVDYMESGVETLKRGFQEYTKFGVTRFLGTTLSNPLDTIVEQIKLIREAKESSSLGEVLAGVHIEGPWIAERCRGGHAAEYLRTPKKEDVEKIVNEVGDIVRTLTYAPELENTVYLTEQLARKDIIPVFGHTESNYEDAETCILAGARHVTHMYDTTLGYGENPDEALVMMPGMETAVMLYDDVSVELIGCPVHVPKPFFNFVDKVKPRTKKIVVTDSLVGAGLEDGTRLTSKDGRKIYVEKGVLRMIDDDPKVNGNLTGSAVTMNVALRRLCEYAELPVQEGIRWGTINPATTLGIDHMTGSIKVGKYADIAVIDEEFNIYMTMVKGSIAFNNNTI
jgi:N-acetylglucosamine-6-phosphate deacetylase